MKFQSASLLVIASLFASAKAAWEAPSGGNSWDSLCGTGAKSKKGPSHVCFTSRLDETHYNGASYFRGYHQGGHDFVIFHGSRNPAFFQNDHWQIRVTFDLGVRDDPKCANYDVQDLAGRMVANGYYCGGQDPIRLS